MTSAFFGMYAICGLAGGVRFVVDFDTTYQSIEGFGASSAWYSQFIGSYEGENADEFRQRAVDLLYGDNGLRLEIYRYNIGAGSKELYDKGVGDYRTYDKNTNYSPYTATLGRRRDALTESFFDSSVFSGDYSVFSNPNNYSIAGRDEASQKMLAMALNAPLTGRIVMFANSPHYLLTKNGLCLSDNKNENNLKQECFEAFADYAIISAYKLYTGLIVPNSWYFEKNSSKIRISPVNEPQHAWSLDTTDQEGCHYDPEYLADFYQVFFERLNFWNRKWNTSFKMDVFESGSYKDSNKNDSLNTRTYIQAFEKKEFWQSIDEISMHDYGAENSVSARKSFIRQLDKKDYDKSVAISEYCNMIEGRDLSMTTAILDSQIISRDLTILNATSWSWWLACASENYNSTLVYYDVVENDKSTTLDDEYKITLPKRYFAVKHYSAFIMP
ncbi:MAG: hypothetical protein IJ226_05020, partial [Clostridia bacterium]|nr:hypothetical protein [Clostridia bacterium]